LERDGIRGPHEKSKTCFALQEKNRKKNGKKWKKMEKNGKKWKNP